ncbi:MAG TPA: CPBP family intramembrane glutamic endopeptidase [Blastocatellia bacterium]|nr:CPBP family intramembrane glutamic endopeptidase [Blastocatellia bacterium]
MGTGNAAQLSAAAAVQPPATPLSRRVALCEIGCLLLCMELIMWLVPLMPGARAAYAGLAVLIVVLLAVTHLRDGATARELGFRFDNFLPALGWVGARLAPFVAVILLVGAATHSLRFGGRFYGMLLTVPLWALLQQYMLFVFVHRRLRVVLGEGRRAVLVTAALFALLHLPNPMLTLACAIAGTVWARAYERTPNLFANAVTHTVASALLANSLPHWLLKNMVVGTNHFFR